MSVTLKMSALPAALAIAAVVAGCGSSSSGSSGSSSGSNSAAASGQSGGYGASVHASAPAAATAAAAAAGAHLTITTAQSGSIGTYLVDGHKHAIYLFKKDRQGSGMSTCSGGCAVAWPPVLTKGSPKVSGGVMSGKLTTLSRGHGAKQLVYNGWPLYFYAADSAGTTNGQGLNAFGGLWFVMTPAGHQG